MNIPKMFEKKLLLSKVLYHSKLVDFFSFLSIDRLIVCNYHRLYDDKLNTKFDDGVFAHSVIHFENHLVWLIKNTKILTENELIDIIKSGKNIRKLCSLITFDDGYIDNYLLAYPILKRLGVPAIYFIPSSPIISRQLGWWDIIAYLIKKSNKTSIFYEDDLVSLENKDKAISVFQKAMKTEPYEKTVDLLLKLSEGCNVPLPETDIQSGELMTWDQIREISHNGIDIGSHTHSHRVLSTIIDDEQKEEMLTSKSIIESEIGKKVRTIAYPVGNYQHFTHETMDIAEGCGYEAAFSFNTGVNHRNNFSKFDIKRIEPSKSVEMLVFAAVFPNFFI